MKTQKIWNWRDQPLLTELIVGGVLVFVLLVGSRFNYEKQNTYQDLSSLQSSILLAKANYQSQLQLLNQRLFLKNVGSMKNEGVDSLLAQMKVQQQLLQAENDRLREVLNLTQSLTNEARRINVPILSVPQRLIELPQEVTPVAGQVVIGDRSLLGWVSAVQAKRARVDLLADIGSLRLVATTSSGFTGVVTNQNGGLYLTEVPTQYSLQVGDIVLTTAQLTTPPGLVLGKIQSITTDVSGSMQTGFILPEEYFGEKPLVWMLSDSE